MMDPLLLQVVGSSKDNMKGSNHIYGSLVWLLSSARASGAHVTYASFLLSALHVEGDLD